MYLRDTKNNCVKLFICHIIISPLKKQSEILIRVLKNLLRFCFIKNYILEFSLNTKQEIPLELFITNTRVTVTAGTSLSQRIGELFKGVLPTCFVGISLLYWRHWLSHFYNVFSKNTNLTHFISLVTTIYSENVRSENRYKSANIRAPIVKGPIIALVEVYTGHNVKSNIREQMSSKLHCCLTVSIKEERGGENAKHAQVGRQKPSLSTRKNP